MLNFLQQMDMKDLYWETYFKLVGPQITYQLFNFLHFLRTNLSSISPIIQTVEDVFSLVTLGLK